MFKYGADLNIKACSVQFRRLLWISVSSTRLGYSGQARLG